MSEILSDYDLCMLEHLAYMNADDGLKNTLKGEKYIPLEECDNIKTYLQQFDTTTLRTDNPNGYSNGDCINRCEYAAIIDYMLNNPGIYSLSVKTTMENAHAADSCPLAYDFVYPEGSQENANKEHIVIFKGTTKGFEWGDNIEGIDQADTQSQREAAAFIDKIGSNNITVVGHSKGGNKAMYCAIVSDKVTRCVSMDGQGFSDEFIEKYQYRIIKSAQNIKNYSYSSDYVHALLIQIPGSKQLYTGKGYGSNGADSFGGCHSPNSVFSYYIDETGKLVVKDDFELTEETETIHIITEFIEYLMHSDCSNKEELIKYLTYIVACAGENADSFKQKILSGDESIDVDKLTTLLAYLIKYCNAKDISPEELYVLLLNIHVIDGTANIGGVDMLSVIRLAFDYIKSNEEDQNYLIAKVFILWKDRLNDKDKSHDRYYDMAWKVLKNIKGKYNDIRYDPSKKAVIYTDKLKKINALTDFREKGAPAMFYNMVGIETALAKIKELDGLYIENDLNNLDAVSGKCADMICALNDMYNSVLEKLCTLLLQTKNQVQGVYDAVYALENL